MAQGRRFSASLGKYREPVQEALSRLEAEGFQRRLFDKDPSLWPVPPVQHDVIRHRLGWLTVTETMAEQLDDVRAFADEVRERGFRRAVLLGMGGSSLAPEVFQQTFGAADGHPPLIVLDTTDASQITAVERALDIERTLFIVSSKSGTTIETLSLYRYFAQKFGAGRGEEEVTLDNFVAITDPATPLEKQAKNQRFLRVFSGRPDIGGRYSALSAVGLVPAAVIGVDVARILERADELESSAGIELGAILGTLALAGRDKVTFVASPSVESFGAWAEQLLAESTGKDGKGIIPVDREPLGPPSVYGNDRLFVAISLEGEELPEDGLRALEVAGHPVVRLSLRDRYDLGGEFLRWEIATAVAGAILGINPFDEPNVAEAKERTTEVLQESFRGERIPDPEPGAFEGEISVYMNPRVRELLGRAAGEEPIAWLLGADLGGEGDYFAIMAFIARTPEHDKLLTDLRLALRDATGRATSVGYGPRFLHSTGQLFKGGPDKGVFIQIIAEDREDLPIPGEFAFGFNALKRAQALGDLKSLEARRPRVIRPDLGGYIRGGLERLTAAVNRAQPAGARSGGA